MDSTEPSWILETDDRFTVNKEAALDKAIRNEDPEVLRMVLDTGTTTEKVWLPVVFYIHRCLTPALPMGTRSSCMD